MHILTISGLGFSSLVTGAVAVDNNKVLSYLMGVEN